MNSIKNLIKSKWFQFFVATKLVMKIAVLTFLMNSCMTYEDVQFQGISNFKVEKIDKEKVKLKFEARINNPNDYNISVKANNIDLGVNGKSLARASIGKKVIIKKNTTDSYPVEVTVKLKELMAGLGSSMMDMFTGGSINLSIKGDARAGAKGLSKKFPIEYSYPLNPSELNLGGFSLFN